MRIYQIIYQDPDQGHCIRWEGTGIKARKAAREISDDYKSEGKDVEVEIKRVKLPENKRDMLAWLNTHFTKDNG